MKRLTTAFFMAWGMFCAIPCPYQRWDERLRPLMLVCFPLLGVLLGGIWSSAAWLIARWGGLGLFGPALLAALPCLLTGFLHLDGFMDCCDAIMSRRPLEQRQLILKDSSTGAFAVVGMIFFVLGYFCFLSTAVTTGVDFANMVMVVVMSRSISGLHVLICKPMGQSQYAMLHDAEPPEETLPEETLPEETLPEEEPTEETTTEEDCTELVACDSVETASKKASAKSGVILLLVLLAVITTLALWCSSLWLATLIVSAATALGSLISIQYAKKNLGGMSGDIAGFGIIWGELMGVFALVLC